MSSEFAVTPSTIQHPTMQPSMGQGEEEASFTDLLAILRRRWKIIAATIAIITIPSALYGLFRAPGYTAASQVVIQSTSGLGATDQVKSSSPSEDPAIVATEVNLMLSRPIVIRTMDSLELFGDPEFQGKSKLTSWLWSVATSSPAAMLTKASDPTETASISNPATGDFSAPEGIPSMNKVRSQSLETFYKNLNVDIISNSHVIEIAFTSKDPRKAATISNRLAQLYVQDRLDNKVEEALKANTWTIEQLTSQKKLVLAAEAKVAELMSQRQFVTDRGAVLTTNDMVDMNKALFDTTAELVRLGSKLKMIDDLRAKGGALDTIAEVLSSPVIAQLRMQALDLSRQVAESVAVYGDRNPRTEVLRKYLAEVSERVTEEVNRIIDSLRNQQASLAAQAKELQARLDNTKARYKSDNFAAIELSEAQRDATAKRAMYEDLLRRAQQTSRMLGAQESGARIISAAVPPTEPSSLGLASIAAVGFVLSSLLGSGLALLREQADKKLRSQRQAEKFLQVPCIALVPEAKKGAPGVPQHTYLLRNPRSAYAQAIRGICTLLDLNTPKAKAILISSSVPSEGKTRLAVDIAVCVAQQGQRTVLVDLDNYQPMVAHNLGLEINSEDSGLFTPGKNAVVNLDQALVLDQSTGIDILPIGNRAQDTLSMWGSEQIDALFKALKKRYQFVVIDSPPLLSVSDGRVLAKYADATLFAVRWGETDRDTAAAGVQILKNVGANVVGSVLTRVDVDKLATYGEGAGQQQQLLEHYAA